MHVCRIHFQIIMTCSISLGCAASCFITSWALQPLFFFLNFATTLGTLSKLEHTLISCRERTPRGCPRISFPLATYFSFAPVLVCFAIVILDLCFCLLDYSVVDWFHHVSICGTPTYELIYTTIFEIASSMFLCRGKPAWLRSNVSSVCGGLNRS